MNHRALPRLMPLLVAMLMLAALAGCGAGEAKSGNAALAAPATPLPVRTAIAERGDLYARYQATSTITADGEARVPARIGGEVRGTLAEEGDTVSKGQVLARVDGKRLRLRMLEARALLTQRENEYRRKKTLLERGLVSRAACESLKFEVDELRAAYQLDQLNYRYAVIRAPISGIITARHIRVGQHIGKGEPAFDISNTSRLLAKLKLPQRELSRIQVGQEASLNVDAWPDVVFSAEIIRISPTVDMRNGSITATALIDDGTRRLAPGMFARFSIRYARHQDTLTVPARSIGREDGESIVYRVDDGRAFRQVVEVGITGGDRTEILSGLAPGDEIVVSGSGGLKDGTYVLADTAARQFAGA